MIKDVGLNTPRSRVLQSWVLYLLIMNNKNNNSNNHKNYNFLDFDWFENLLFSTNSLTKLLSDSLLLDTLLSDSSISQSHSKL